jgi:hypothetical protein
MKKNAVIMLERFSFDKEQISELDFKDFSSIKYQDSDVKSLLKSKSDKSNLNFYYFKSDDIDENIKDNLLQNNNFIILFSDFFILDESIIEDLFFKIKYITKNIKIESNNNIFGMLILNQNLSTFYKNNLDNMNLEKYDSIIYENGVIDLKIYNNIINLVSSKLDSRYFNSLTQNKYIITKRSINFEKIIQEYNFFKLLDEKFKDFFIQPFDLEVEKDYAQYKMHKMNFFDLSLRWTTIDISVDEFKLIMDYIFFFLSIKNRTNKTNSRYDSDFLYVNKVKKRQEEFKNISKYLMFENIISNATSYKTIDQIYEQYYSLYFKIHSTNDFTISHGDLCFSNILYSKSTRMFKFIDPKGALTYDDLYMDEYYDIAKLSHSILGSYDFINNGKFEILFNSDLKMYLSIKNHNQHNKIFFIEKLKENNLDYNKVRLYEASLFLSMVPLHIDSNKKILGFLLTAIEILEELNR